MEKGLDKLLRKLVLKKYPMYLDIRVVEDSGIGYVYSTPNKCYDVFLITSEQEYNEDMHIEVKDYVRSLAKYMDVELCGVWRKVVTEKEWEKMNSDEPPSW
jgi:hypothetical protein